MKKSYIWLAILAVLLCFSIVVNVALYDMWKEAKIEATVTKTLKEWYSQDRDYYRDLYYETLSAYHQLENKNTTSRGSGTYNNPFD